MIIKSLVVYYKSDSILHITNNNKRLGIRAKQVTSGDWNVWYYKILGKDTKGIFFNREYSWEKLKYVFKSCLNV